MSIDMNRTPGFRLSRFERVCAAAGGVVFLAVAAVMADPIREVEVTTDPPDKGQQMITIRMTPGETATYDVVAFSCVYRQVFASETSDQTGKTVVHEPEKFVYRRKDFKMVDDLDCHVSFRVPVSLDRLKAIYGDTTFRTNAPVTIPRLTVSASVNKQVQWSFEVPTSGTHKPSFPPPPPPPSPTPTGQR